MSCDLLSMRNVYDGVFDNAQREVAFTHVHIHVHVPYKGTAVDVLLYYVHTELTW